MCEAGSLLAQCKVLRMSCLDLTIWRSPLLAVAAALVKPVMKWSTSKHVVMHHGDRIVTTRLQFIYGRAQTLQREVGMVKMASQLHWAWSWLMNVSMVWIILSYLIVDPWQKMRQEKNLSWSTAVCQWIDDSPFLCQKTWQPTRPCRKFSCWHPPAHTTFPWTFSCMNSFSR